MSDAPAEDLVGQLRRANRHLRQLLEDRSAEIEALHAENAGLHTLVHSLTLRIEKLEHHRDSGSDDSGTPTSKDSIQARARRKSERASDQTPKGGSGRERSKDRKRGAQPGHPGHGLTRDPNPQVRMELNPPTACRACGEGLGDAGDAGTAWSQVWDVRVVRHRVEYLLPRRVCGCGVTTTSTPPQGGKVNSVSFGPRINTAAVALTAFGNVPVQRAADLVGMLLDQPVSAGFVDRANARLASNLAAAGFPEALRAALMAEPVLTADESPVEVVTPATDPTTGQPVAGSPHVMVIRTPDERLAWLTAFGSRCYDTVIAGLGNFSGHLIVDGYGAYQRLLNQTGSLLAGIQQCCSHILRRCRGVAKLGPGTLQSSWTGEVQAALKTAHTEVEATRKRGETALDQTLLAGLRERYDKALRTGIIHNRHRDWDGPGKHPAFVLATWLEAFAGQVWWFTTHFMVDWTSNAAERGVKPAKRHQAVSGYWQTDATLGRWCLIQSYLTSARNSGLTILDAITSALMGRPWKPELGEA